MRRLAGVGDLDIDELLGVFLERGRDLEQREAALGRSRASPRLERPGGCLAGCLDIGVGRYGGAGVLLAGGGIDDGRGLVSASVDEPAVDEVLQDLGHAWSPPFVDGFAPASPTPRL